MLAGLSDGPNVVTARGQFSSAWITITNHPIGH